MDSRLKEMTAVLKKYKLTHGLTPEKFRLILQELGPTYIKLGQIMSLHSDILPKEYCEELMKLCSDVEPMPFEQVEAVIDASFGYSWKDVFASIDKNRRSPNRIPKRPGDSAGRANTNIYRKTINIF